MKESRRYLRELCLLPLCGMLLSMWLCILFFCIRAAYSRPLLSMGLALSLLALGWTLFLLWLLEAKLTAFTSDLCRTIDRMTEGGACPDTDSDQETLQSRINCRLLRLYQIMQTQRHAAETEHQKLQQLITDISHQVRTPVSNLRLVTDTLLTRPGSYEEQTAFLEGLRAQTDKLHFLFQALLKTSRLETGAIQLQKETPPCTRPSPRPSAGFSPRRSRSACPWPWTARRSLSCPTTAGGRQRPSLTCWTTRSNTRRKEEASM